MRTEAEIRFEINKILRMPFANGTTELINDTKTTILMWVLNDIDAIDYENEQEKADRECESEQDRRTMQYIDEHREKVNGK